MQNNNSGLPDPSFANGGLFRLPDVGQQQYVTALAPRRTGGILSVATARSFDSYYLYGLCADGTLDERFRGAGCFQDDFGQPAIARLLHARDDGKFLVAAELAHGVALARYEADGRWPIRPDLQWRTQSHYSTQRPAATRGRAFTDATESSERGRGFRRFAHSN